MKFSVQKETLLETLSVVTGVIEKRQTLPVLANVLLESDGDHLILTGTDLEVQMSARLLMQTAPDERISITVPAKKLFDITKSLAADTMINFTLQENKIAVVAGRSRFTLSTLSSDDFPSVDKGDTLASFSTSQQQIKTLMDQTAFAMAQQDVRFYLNGMLWEISSEMIRTVTTDGHRLALCDASLEQPIQLAENTQIIVPRKAINELSRILSASDDKIEIVFGKNHLYVANSFFTFTTKLIDGKFPDYQRVLPKSSDKTVFGLRQDLKETFQRAAILSNEKYRGIQLLLSSGKVEIKAANPEKEEAEDAVNVDYQGDNLEIGFNVNYLIDVMNIITDDQVKFSFSDANSSVLIEAANHQQGLYVIMPMRL